MAMGGQPAVAGPTLETLDAKSVLAVLKRRGVTHLVWLPDSESAALYELVSRDADITLVQVCREGETFAVAAGLFLAGKKPVVLIQSTGLFEAGDSIRGLALWLRLPLLLLVGYRGWQPEGQSQDTAAHFLEPILNAWGIEHRLVRSAADAGLIEAALERAERLSTPTAVLVAAEWS